jgi:endoglucanase
MFGVFRRARSESRAAKWTVWAGLICAGFLGCKGGQVASKQPQASAPELAPVVGNPFDGVSFFIPPYTNADQARRRLQSSNPAEAELVAKIADTPQARWLGEWSGEPKTAAGNFMRSAAKANQSALFIAYNIPNRDCGQYSKGGASDPEKYKQWIRSFAEGIGSDKRAVIVLEPDALGHLTECLAKPDQEQRLALLAFAVETLEALPGVSVYLDAGHSRWVPAEDMAERLKAAGVGKARGFALNTSNYIADEELIAYGDKIVSLIGETHYIIDSSRNGNGPTEDSAWCNPAGRALGRRPTADTGNPNLDAYAWLKNPGESDGECAGGPAAGRWFHERAIEMAKNAKW